MVLGEVTAQLKVCFYRDCVFVFWGGGVNRVMGGGDGGGSELGDGWG